MSQLIQITEKNGLPIEEKPLDLEKVKAKLAETNGQGYWQRLEELAETPGFGQMMKREFPLQAPKDWAPLPRRDFVKLMGAAMALAGLSGCAFQPQEKIVPFVNAPEEVTPGIPLFYATAMPFMGYALGVLAESNEGRPTKLEGNPDHPTTAGGTNIWLQAEILNMYDPDRSQTIRHGSSSSNWDDFAGQVASKLRGLGNGEGFALVTETVTSPTQLSLIKDLQAAYPKMQWVSYEPINRDSIREGVRLAFGKNLQPQYHFNRADVVVSLDCDFLHEEPGSIQYARDFIGRRKLTDNKGNAIAVDKVSMNRLYTFESTVTPTGAMADHRFPVKASEIEDIARAIAARVGVPGVGDVAQVADNVSKSLGPIVDDLKANRGKVLVVAGAHQSAAVHALAHAITAQLGSASVSGTISYHPPVDGGAGAHDAGIKKLVNDMNAGKVKAAVFMNANPAYTLPADLKFADALKKVEFTAHYGGHVDETSVLCQWHVPAAHFLEYWGDIRALDGTISVIQPLIQPLYEAAKSPIELLAALSGRPGVSGYDALYEYWVKQLGGGTDNLEFQKKWQTIVHKGQIDKTATNAVGVSLRTLSLGARTTPISGLEVNFRPDPTLLDGRYANNGWLQECPKPNLQTVWDNAIILAPNTATKLGLKNNSEVEVALNGQKIKGGVLMLPGQPEDVATLHLGYGRETVGKIGTGAGFDANKLRTSQNPWFAAGATITKTGGVYKIASTNTYNLIAPKGKDTTVLESILHSDEAKTKVINNILAPETRDLDIDGLHGRDLVRVGTFEDYKKHKLPTAPIDKKGIPLAYPSNPEEFRKAYVENYKDPNHDASKDHGKDGHDEHFSWRKQPVQLDRENEGYPAFYPRVTDHDSLTPYKDDSVTAAAAAAAKAKGRDHLTHQWGMSVDLHSCIGCNACVIGCQAENNTAIVGKDQVLMGRSMHWMRIDTYYRGSYENPEVYFEPMMCQHCEKAPCEPVCPFNATVHSPEGISEQVYNRCVGTKYCENNCPYKVRRFNFLQYSDQQTPVIQLMSNPDVTVRSRGVMEKCSYCVQRVQAAKAQAQKEDRDVKDGDVIVACQQACPTNAITFGDINDPNSVVSKHKRGELTFGLLTEFNTLPRTTYTARFKNPNPALVEKDEEQGVATLEPKRHGGGHGDHDEDHGSEGKSEH
jgi:MoCo/4Fe-4S cofactor protein with predicted Tat translocation signal